MSEHSDLVHIWANQWSDKAWKTKGKVVSNMRKNVHAKTYDWYGCPGSCRGGIRGVHYYHYNTALATVVWSNKLKEHVYLVENNLQCNWTRCTTKVISKVWNAIPLGRKYIRVPSMMYEDRCGLIDIHLPAGDSAEAQGLNYVRSICDDIMQYKNKFWTDSSRKASQKSWRQKYIMLLVALLDFYDLFTQRETGITNKMAAQMEHELNQYRLWRKDFAKLTAEDIANQIKEAHHAAQKAAFESWQSSLKDAIGAGDSNIAVDLRKIQECFDIRDYKDMGEAFKATIQAAAIMRIDVRNVSDVSRLLRSMQYYVAYNCYRWDTKNKWAAYKAGCQPLCELMGIQYLDINGHLSRQDELLFFINTTSDLEEVYTTKYCYAPYREVKILLQAYCNGRSIHGKAVGAYKIVSANKSVVVVGCHRFSGKFLRYFNDILCGNTTEHTVDQAMLERGISLLEKVGATTV
jgi:hypothetical protein